MDRRDWLLVYCWWHVPPEGSKYPLDPIRIMKGMFLLSKEAGIPVEESYEFRPYSYGPLSFGIYEDLDALVADGLLEGIRERGQTWPIYSTTRKGDERASALLSNIAPTVQRKLAVIKEAMMSKPFLELLRLVYERYPEYAVNSVVKIQPSA